MSARLPLCLLVAGIAGSALATAGERTPREAAPPHETAAAREQARQCERLNLEEGAAACRAALALGIGAARRPAVRLMLARDLVALEAWDELAELYREEVRLAPGSASAWEKLGRTLFFALDRRPEALAALREAVRLAPADAAPRVTLGLALAADGSYGEAVASLREALRLDPDALAGRPAARAVLEAAERGQPWP